MSQEGRWARIQTVIGMTRSDVMYATATAQNEEQTRATLSVEAPDCSFDHDCVCGGHRSRCKGLRCLAAGCLFVQPPDSRKNGCPYHLVLGADTHICACTVRSRLYTEQGE